MIGLSFARLPALSLVNARLVSAAGAHPTTLHLRAGRVAALGGPPPSGSRVVDLEGAFVYPGLINAHDHLELNNFPRLKWQERHTNARDWIAGFPPRFKTDPRLSEPLRVPLNDRLFLGGLKNLLSGVTTVCHHNPLHPALRRCGFPVRVVRHYGWSHSLLVDGEAAVARAYRATPRGWPWIIHAAEGVDAEAATELGRLDALGCLGANTVLVHGVGLSAADRTRLVGQGGGLIWCPSSNLFMLSATAQVGELAQAGRVALGSDSRLSGERDLLGELRCAATTGQVSPVALFDMVTTRAADLLRLPDAGRLAPGLPADLLVLPARLPDPFENLITAKRSDLSLVMIGGEALYGARVLAAQLFTNSREAVPVLVDGKPKWLRRGLAQRLWANAAQEPGLLPDPAAQPAPQSSPAAGVQR
jgi:cytosine/adenosine deaminase-related metal-dependent hydrolase